MTNLKAETTRCSAWQHPEFQVEYASEIPPPDINALISFLEETVEGGSRYENGELIEFGSMLLKIATSNGFLTLEEPDMRSFPNSWAAGVTRSMKLLRLQKDVAESIGLGGELDPPSIRSSLLIGVDLAEDSKTLIVARTQSAGADSGWFIGSLDTAISYNDEANLRCISVYQALLNWPVVAGFLALPAGARIEIRGTSTVISRNGEPLEIQRGSLLDVLADRSLRSATDRTSGG